MTDHQINNIILMAAAMAKKAKIEAVGEKYYQSTEEYKECLDIIDSSTKELRKSI